ncbi:MAG: hypothetical protein Q7J25_13365 [Vicinamibacterales bacterium]|nr:hypothetical protein [Vicinamibacterales bacterium]
MTDPATTCSRGTVALAAATGVVFVAGALLEVSPLNGLYWTWNWRDLGVLATAVRMLPGLVPTAWVVWVLRGADPLRPRMLLAALAASCLLHQILGILADPIGIRLIGDIVRSPLATSYYTDALSIHSSTDFLAGFHDASLQLHSSTHPPGPVLFYRFWIWMFGPEAGAGAGAAVIAGLAAAGVPLIYVFSGLWTADPKERVTVAALYSLLPGLVLMYPEFDQVYPLFSMGIIYAWVRAVTGDPRWAVVLGVLLCTAVFFAYGLLTLGAFLAIHAALQVARKGDAPEALRRIARTSAIALGVWCVLLLLLRTTTGFRPLASFLHALAAHEAGAGGHGRPWLACVIFDPYDFVLGAGILALPLTWVYCERIVRTGRDWTEEERLSLIGLAVVGIVDLSGLLRAETARVWLFLQPLLLLPAGLALARLPAGGREGLVGLQWIILVVIKAKMQFINL